MKNLSNTFLIIASVILLLAISSCNSGTKTESADLDQNTHKVSVKEVIQVSEYTYLRVLNDDTEQWLAVPKMEAKVGETYYYKDGMMMTNFASNELGRTFEAILFLEKISTDPKEIQSAAGASSSMGGVSPGGAMNSMGQGKTGAMPKPSIEKVDVKIDPVAGGITIAKLFENKEKYAGKAVKVRGQVTKVNNGIMGKNWIHLQDGTSFGENIDLTITSGGTFNVGDIVTFEGKISLNKDFGYGYSYEVLMEDAEAK